MSRGPIYFRKDEGCLDLEVARNKFPKKSMQNKYFLFGLLPYNGIVLEEEGSLCLAHIFNAQNAPFWTALILENYYEDSRYTCAFLAETDNHWCLSAYQNST